MDNITRSNIEQIQAAAAENRLVIFVGAGISMNSGVPGWSELIDTLKTELPKSMQDESDMLKIAQFYKELRKEKEYTEKIKDILKHGRVSPNPLHKSILDLNPCHIVTTNYDDLLEQSALLHNKQFYVVSKDEDLPCNRGEKIIIKMHGDFSTGNIVLTENDYFDYSRNFPLIRSFVMSLFASKLVLFVGFSFNDINLKYILRNISNILHDKMQKAYLLTDSAPDNLTYEYYKAKGICLMNVLEAQGESVGDRLLEQLKVIKSYDQHEGNIIARAMAFLSQYGDQVAFLGKHIRYIIPKDKRNGFYISSGNIRLPEAYTDNFKKAVESEDTRRALVDKYGERIYDLIAFLLDNQIDSIEDFSIRNEKYLREYENRRPDFAADKFYELDLVRFSAYIKELRHKPLSHTHSDLQLPFALYKIGRYRESYDLFKRLATEFWKKRKYFLYFICMFNLRGLASKMYSEISFDPLDDSEELHKEMAGHDLQEILNNLPLENDLKAILNDILNFKIVKDLLIEVSELQEKIGEQRESAENGGWSINGHIQELLYSFRQSFDFCNENCLINDFYSESREVYRKIAAGILDSVMTLEKETHWQTKLKCLNRSHLLLFVFLLKPSEMESLLANHVNKQILVDRSFREGLQYLTSNLVHSLDKVDFVQHKILPEATVADYVKNIVLLCNYIDNPPVLERIYELINDTWFKGRYVMWASHIGTFMEQQKPTPEMAAKIIGNILHSVGYFPERIEDVVAFLANIVGKGGQRLTELTSLDQIKVECSVIYTSAFAGVVNDTLKTEIINYVRENATCLYDLVMAEIYTGIHFLTPELLLNFSEKVESPRSHLFFTEEVTFSCLIQLCKEKRPDLQVTLKKVAQKNKCLQYLQSPKSFKPL